MFARDHKYTFDDRIFQRSLPGNLHVTIYDPYVVMCKLFACAQMKNDQIFRYSVNLCSRDTATRDHAFPSGLLATPTTVSKTSHGRCVHRVKRPYCVYFQTLNST